VLPGPALLARHVDPRRLRGVMGLWSAYMPLGMALGLALAPLAYQTVGWRPVWWAIAAACLAMAVVLGPVVGADPRSRVPDDALGLVRDTLRSPRPWLLAGAFAEDMSLLNGERIVRLVELDASGEAVPPCCVLGVAPDAASTPAARPARTAASETGSRIELNDESINCSSTKARTPHRNGLDPGWTVAVVSEFRTHSQSDSRADPRLRSPLRRSDAPSGISPPRKLKLSPSDKIG
jgi:hypothetical protein